MVYLTALTKLRQEPALTFYDNTKKIAIHSPLTTIESYSSCSPTILCRLEYNFKRNQKQI